MHYVGLTNQGGPAFVNQDGIEVAKKRLGAAITSFEYLYRYATINNSIFIFLGVSRPGSKTVSEIFFDELKAVLELSSFRCPIIVCGDFNIHVDIGVDPHAVRLAHVLKSFDCIQHVDKTTQNAGQVLVLVITRSETQVSKIEVGDMISIHTLI